MLILVKNATIVWEPKSKDCTELGGNNLINLRTHVGKMPQPSSRHFLVVPPLILYFGLQLKVTTAPREKSDPETAPLAGAEGLLHLLTAINT